MAPYPNRDQLVIFDADGTTIDAFQAIEQTFLRHNMAIGDLERFQKRLRVFKYLGGLREFPNNLRHQFGKQNRKRLLAINPARCYACGDEYSDYVAAIGAGMYPFIVAYGAEDRLRLRKAFDVPDAVIHASPAEFAGKLLHALGRDEVFAES